VPGKTDQAGFLSALWGDREGIAELTLIATGNKVTAIPFAYPSQLGKLISAAGDYTGKANVYMGVCLRNATWPKGKRGSSEMALSSEVVWVDLDFKLFDPDLAAGRAKALAAMKAFPIRPSIIVKTGGGAHLYWLLREAAVGEELRRIPLVNAALAAHLNGDPKARDLARILRLPGTPNMKYTPSLSCEISGWNPELRYTLDDFDLINPADVKDQGPQVPRKTPGVALEGTQRAGIVTHVSALWLKGWRHEMALAVAGALAHKGICEESALDIVREVANENGGEVEKRLKDVSDTYEAFRAGKHVKGITSIRETVEREWDAASRGKGKWHVNMLSSAIQKVTGRGGDGGDGEDGGDGDGADEGNPGFEILRIVRYQQEPPAYEVVISLGGSEYSTSSDLDTIYHYENFFRKLFFSQHHRFLPVLKQNRWQRMVEQAPTETRKVEITEGTLAGRIDGAMADMLEDCVGEKGGEVALRHAPVRLDSGLEVFKTTTLMRYLRAQGLEVDRQSVIKHLVSGGWESTTHRVASKVVRVWGKAEPANGHDPLPPVKVDLFSALFTALDAPANEPPDSVAPPGVEDGVDEV
jgi:hypothetical protein